MIRDIFLFSKDNSRINEAAAVITDGSKTEYEALERIYDWVTHNISYDVEKYLSGSPYKTDPVKTIQEEKGICGDYAKLTEQLLLAVGIEAEIKSGEVVTERGTEQHAWNEARADGVLYALDTIWGSGFLTEEGQTFIRRPCPLYLTSPEELRKLHRDADYRQQQYENWMRKEALAAAPQYIKRYEDRIFDLVNQDRRDASKKPLRHSTGLQSEARALAIKIAERECKSEKWSLDLQSVGNKLNQSTPYVSNLGANVYLYWGNVSLTPEEIYRLWVDDSKNQGIVLSTDFNSLGIGVVQRGELIVLCKLFAYCR